MKFMLKQLLWAATAATRVKPYVESTLRANWRHVLFWNLNAVFKSYSAMFIAKKCAVSRMPRDYCKEINRFDCSLLFSSFLCGEKMALSHITVQCVFKVKPSGLLPVCSLGFGVTTLQRSSVSRPSTRLLIPATVLRWQPRCLLGRYFRLSI